VNADIRCSAVDGAERAARYVAGTLPEAERAAFEDHFVLCAACQREIAFASAARGAAIHELHDGARQGARQGVRQGAGRDAHTNVRAPARARTLRVAAVAAVTAIAAGFALMLFGSSVPPELAALGAVAEAPVYLGIAVRGGFLPSRGDSAFDRAVALYSGRDYAKAAAEFTIALAAGEDSVPTQFFLGASQLLTNESRAAAGSFAAVIAHGDTPYRDEAQLYEAKALLRLGRGSDALTVLKARTPRDTQFAKIIFAFSDSIARALAR
jgi:hypothetical protein